MQTPANNPHNTAKAVEAKALDQCPENPEFWCKRFASASTPWLASTIPGNLRRFAASGVLADKHILIPGCGNAPEAGWLAAQGHAVTALDFSPTAIEQAQTALAGWSGQLVCADFFNYTPVHTVDVIYERAFLCALPRKLWSDWAKQLAALLPSGGLLAGFFYFDASLKGPPFAITPAALAELLSPAFVCLGDEAAEDSIPLFAGKERWQVWQRQG